MEWRPGGQLQEPSEGEGKAISVTWGSRSWGRYMWLGKNDER